MPGGMTDDALRGLGGIILSTFGLVPLGSQLPKDALNTHVRDALERLDGFWSLVHGPLSSFLVKDINLHSDRDVEQLTHWFSPPLGRLFCLPRKGNGRLIRP